MYNFCWLKTPRENINLVQLIKHARVVNVPCSCAYNWAKIIKFKCKHIIFVNCSVWLRLKFGRFILRKRHKFCAFISAPLINYWVVRDGDKSERRIISKIGDKISASLNIISRPKTRDVIESDCETKHSTHFSPRKKKSIASQNFNLIDIKKNWTLKQMLIYHQNQMHTLQPKIVEMQFSFWGLQNHLNEFSIEFFLL